jgi:hypothetical protein
MAFPNSLEAKFTRVVRTPAKTIVDVKIYQVTDGGLDILGLQLYIRTLWKSKTLYLDAGITKQEVVTRLKAKLAQWNTEDNLGYATQNQICDL